MPFDILQARSLDDAPNRLYPMPMEAKNSFQLEPEDGTVTSFIVGGAVGSLRKGERSQEVARCERVKGVMAVTQSRVVFACTEFRTGARMSGYGTAGVLVAVTHNAIAKASAVKSTRGYSLLGHVRYEWLLGVTAIDAKWGKHQNSVRLTFTDPTDPTFLNTLTLFPPNKERSRAIGKDIAYRAARANARALTGDAAAKFNNYAADLPVSELHEGGGEYWTLPSRPKPVTETDSRNA